MAAALGSRTALALALRSPAAAALGFAATVTFSTALMTSALVTSALVTAALMLGSGTTVLSLRTATAAAFVTPTALVAATAVTFSAAASSNTAATGSTGIVFGGRAKGFGDFGFGDFFAQETFDTGKLALFLFGDKGVGRSLRGGPGRTADAVYVVFAVVGDVVVNDQVYIVDVDATAEDIRGHQYFQSF